MNPERFKDSPSGRLVRARERDQEYWAFVPNPLPPRVEIDDELADVLSQAAYAVGELAGLERNLSNPHLLLRPFIRREAVLSSKIEGTKTDIAELYAYEAGQRYLPGMAPPPPQSDLQEVLNYVRALEYGLERVKELPVCLRLVQELHERLMEGTRGGGAHPGQFRQRQNYIGHNGLSIQEAPYVPPPVAQMQEALDAFERYLHSEGRYPRLMQLGLIHYQFEAIHPFLDGNGRMGRLLSSLLLVHWGMLPMPLLYLSAYFEKFRERYFSLLRAISEGGAWRDWLLFFLQGVVDQSKDATSRAKSLQDLQADWRGRISGARASALLPRLVDSLFDTPFITIPDAARTLHVTYRAAERNVMKLVEADILRQVAEGSYRRMFIAQEVIRIVERDKP